MQQPSDLTMTTDAYTTTIDWSRFVVEIEGVRGISLRALVEIGGLYSAMGKAVNALKRSGLEFFTCEQKPSDGGRPRTEYLFKGVDDAIEYCIIANTPTARDIRRLLMSHHHEFQRLLSGDEAAHARLAEVALTPALATDPLTLALTAALETRKQVLEHEDRLTVIEAELSQRRQIEAEMMRRLEARPAPVVEVAPFTPRMALVELVSLAGIRAGNSKDAHQAHWRRLYDQFRLRYHIDLRARAKVGGKGKASTLDYAEQQGHIDNLYALACELYPTDPLPVQQLLLTA